MFEGVRAIWKEKVSHENLVFKIKVLIYAFLAFPVMFIRELIREIKVQFRSKKSM